MLYRPRLPQNQHSLDNNLGEPIIGELILESHLQQHQHQHHHHHHHHHGGQQNLCQKQNNMALVNRPLGWPMIHQPAIPCGLAPQPDDLTRLTAAAGFNYWLEAQTSGMARRGEDSLTYLNKDQFYSLVLEYVAPPPLAMLPSGALVPPPFSFGGASSGGPTIADRFVGHPCSSPAGLGRSSDSGCSSPSTPSNMAAFVGSKPASTLISIQFREREKMQNLKEAVAHWELWLNRQLPPHVRVLDVDRLLPNVTVVEGRSWEVEEVAYNAIKVTWNPHEGRAFVNIAVRCLSTDFSNQKGIKGIPLHIQIDTMDEAQVVLDRAYCQIKTFCDKGAERKLREEEKRLQRQPPNYPCQPILRRTGFTKTGPFGEFNYQPLLFNPRFGESRGDMHQIVVMGCSDSGGSGNNSSSSSRQEAQLGPLLAALAEKPMLEVNHQSLLQLHHLSNLFFANHLHQQQQQQQPQQPPPSRLPPVANHVVNMHLSGRAAGSVVDLAGSGSSLSGSDLLTSLQSVVEVPSGSDLLFSGMMRGKKQQKRLAKVTASSASMAISGGGIFHPHAVGMGLSGMARNDAVFSSSSSSSSSLLQLPYYHHHHHHRPAVMSGLQASSLPFATLPQTRALMIYVKQDNEDVYTPLYVCPDTVSGFVSAVSAKFLVEAHLIRHVYWKHRKGMVVKADDDLFKTLHDCAFFMKVLALEDYDEDRSDEGRKEQPQPQLQPVQPPISSTGGDGAETPAVLNECGLRNGVNNSLRVMYDIVLIDDAFGTRAVVGNKNSGGGGDS